MWYLGFKEGRLSSSTKIYRLGPSFNRGTLKVLHDLASFSHIFLAIFFEIWYLQVLEVVSTFRQNKVPMGPNFGMAPLENLELLEIYYAEVSKGEISSSKNSPSGSRF